MSDLRRSSHRFTVLAQGPDMRSTYAECWGAQATSPGRHVADVDSLDRLIETVHDLGHRNYTIRDRWTHRTYTGSHHLNLSPLAELCAAAVIA